MMSPLRLGASSPLTAIMVADSPFRCWPSNRCEQRLHLPSRISRAHDRAHHGDADRTGGEHLGGARGVEPADREDRDARGARDLAEAYAADLRAIARLARSLEGGPGNSIVNDGRIDRFGLSHGMDRHADELVGPQQPARGYRIAARRQMHAVGI